MAEDWGRYARQLKLLGAEGQEKLKNATVMVAGIGGLGGTAALYLAAAGVGKLILAHEGIIAPPDLNRQILMDAERIGEERIPCAVESLKKIAPELKVEAYPERITLERSGAWVEAADIVIDARYDFPERYALNRLCREVGKPMIEAAMYGFEVSLTVTLPGETPCLECLYPDRDAGWEPLGFPVLGATSGLAGCMAALEAVKWITGIGPVTAGRMVRLDTLSLSSISVSLRDIPLCPACEERRRNHGGLYQAAVGLG
ncbi:HesA/MoeB/ThiF family protein [Gorillibacterium sp. sgz5001074]|uniref:HesA/MoeB/ThiF family protein n=1 Tax=Gorillibacterium sp. sgz5001074 TaxID=3446695 RepID=UPI003F66C696